MMDKIFKDKQIFNVNYVPENLYFRNNQLQTLARNIDSLFPENIMITGKCATGKTSTVKLFFKQLKEEYNDNITSIYINCNLVKTEYAILGRIYSDVFQHEFRNGLQTEKLRNAIFNKINDDNKVVLICLDEIDNLNEANSVLYTLTRAGEMYDNIEIIVICVSSNDVSWRFNIDDKVLSTFMPYELVFNQYSREQIYTILKSRCELGFYPNVVSEEELQEIVKDTYNSGNLRKGLKDLARLGAMKE